MFIINIFPQFPCPFDPSETTKQSSKALTRGVRFSREAREPHTAEGRPFRPFVQPHARDFLIYSKIRVVLHSRPFLTCFALFVDLG